MKLIIDIPEAFESHYKGDAFKDSLERLYEDAHALAGNYEKETALMLIDAFKNGIPLDNLRAEIKQKYEKYKYLFDEDFMGTKDLEWVLSVIDRYREGEQP